MKHVLKASLWLLLPLLLGGCAKLALKWTPSLIPGLAQTIFEECDPELARAAIPADLKLMEGLLKQDPDSRALTGALCKGFTGYAFLFVDDDNPKRASALYLRARSYGLKAIGKGDPFMGKRPSHENAVRLWLQSCTQDDVEPLFWTTMSWCLWAQLNMDEPTALADLGLVRACIEKVLEMEPGYFHGAPSILMASFLAAQPPLLGGRPEQSRVYFDKAMAETGRRFLLAQYQCARYYAVRTQNKVLFHALIQEISDTPPDVLKDACLINAVVKTKATRLRQRVDELFY